MRRGTQNRPTVALAMMALYLSGLSVALVKPLPPQPRTGRSGVTNTSHRIAPSSPLLFPRITDRSGDIGRYGSAYIMTGSVFLPLFGRLFTCHSSEWVFLIAIVLFEIGSAICDAAPTPIVFILGRAVPGLG